MKTQDPKYDIQDGRIVNAASGVPVPEDEPLFVLRGKDKNAALALAYYKKLCADANHQMAVNIRLHEFVDFAHEHPDRMKEPDTVR